MICLEIDPPQSFNGFRRTTSVARGAERLADAFQGLPEGVSRWRLAAATRGAARKLGLNASMLALIEHYIDITYDVDWSAGSEPVITRPLVEIAEHLGKSERQVRNIEQALADRGLLVWRDSGNHHRKGRRDRESGRLRYAYGPSLAPLAARAEDIIGMAAEARKELGDIRRLRLAISALRRRFRAAIAERSADAPLQDAAKTLWTEFQRMPDRNPARTSVGELGKQAARLKSIIEILDEDGERSSTTTRHEPEISGKAEEKRRHIPDTNLEKSINGSVVRQEDEDTPTKRERPDEWRKTRNKTRGCEKAGAKPLTFQMARSAAGPRMRFYLEASGGQSGWRELVSAAHGILNEVGISQRIWGEACNLLGRKYAALAILIIERGLDRHAGGTVSPISNPEAYLRAMMDRARAGKLDLQKSIFVLSQDPGR